MNWQSWRLENLNVPIIIIIIICVNNLALAQMCSLLISFPTGHRIRSREATVELNEHNLSTRTKTKSADRVSDQSNNLTMLKKTALPSWVWHFSTAIFFFNFSKNISCHLN